MDTVSEYFSFNLLEISSLILKSSLLSHTRGETSSRENKKLGVSVFLCVTGDKEEWEEGV